jgi:FkbM family methyltransferase
LSLNEDVAKKIEVFPFGLWNKDDVFLQPTFPSSPGTSIVFPLDIDTESPNVQTEKLEVRDASAIFRPIIENNKEGRKILLKIDCEGAEFKILPHLAESGCLAEIDTLIMEFHGNEPEPLVDILRKNGFFVFYRYLTLTHRSLGKLGFLEAVNLRKLTSAEKGRNDVAS